MFFRQNKPIGRIRLSAPAYVSVSPTARAESGKKILIVDDDAVILKTLSMTLQSAGYQVVTATDGSEAISQVRSEKPDLLIVDVFLAADPIGCGALGWDGFQIAEWLHGLHSKASPIVIMSGSDQPEYWSHAAAVGAGSFLTKPIDKELLLSTVATLVSARQPAGSIAN